MASHDAIDDGLESLQYPLPFMEQLGDSATPLLPKDPAHMRIATNNVPSSSLQRSKSDGFLRESILLPKDATMEATPSNATIGLDLSLSSVYRHPRSVDEDHWIAQGGRYHHARAPAVATIVTGTFVPPSLSPSATTKIKTTPPSSPSLSRSTPYIFHRRSPGLDLSSLQVSDDVDDGRVRVTDPSLTLYNHRNSTPPSPTLADSGCNHSEPPYGVPIQNSDVQTSGEIVQAAHTVRYGHDRPSHGLLARVHSSPHRGLPPPSPPPAYPAPRRRVSSSIGWSRSDWQTQTPPSVQRSRGDVDMWGAMRNHPFSARHDPNQEALRLDRDVYRTKFRTIHDEWYELLYAQYTVEDPAINSSKDEDDKGEEANINDDGTKSAVSQSTSKSLKDLPGLPHQTIEGYANGDGIEGPFSGPNQSIVFSKDDETLLLGLALQFSSETDGVLMESPALPDEESVLPCEDDRSYTC